MDYTALFSRREGFVDEHYPQVEELNSRTRSRLFNAFVECCFVESASRSTQLFEEIWDAALGLVNHEVWASGAHLEWLRTFFDESEWHTVLDIVEVCCRYPHPLSKIYPNTRIEKFNKALVDEKTSYRIIDKIVTPISSKIEKDSVQDSISHGSRFETVKSHLKQATRLLSDRNNPDYRNSMKESISAVESLCKKVTGDSKATLGQAIDALDEHIEIDGGMKRAFKAMYGYTSNSDGIRHALKDKTTVTSSDAKYMLVTCSAFVNWVTEKIGENSVPMP